VSNELKERERETVLNFREREERERERGREGDQLTPFSPSFPSNAVMTQNLKAHKTVAL
jgi:hypothetical protein